VVGPIVVAVGLLLWS